MVRRIANTIAPKIDLTKCGKKKQRAKQMMIRRANVIIAI
jgi:hypothetical protein